MARGRRRRDEDDDEDDDYDPPIIIHVYGTDEVVAFPSVIVRRRLSSSECPDAGKRALRVYWALGQQRRFAKAKAEWLARRGRGPAVKSSTDVLTSGYSGRGDDDSS